MVWITSSIKMFITDSQDILQLHILFTGIRSDFFFLTYVCDIEYFIMTGEKYSSIGHKTVVFNYSTFPLTSDAMDFSYCKKDKVRGKEPFIPSWFNIQPTLLVRKRLIRTQGDGRRCNATFCPLRTELTQNHSPYSAKWNVFTLPQLSVS